MAQDKTRSGNSGTDTHAADASPSPFDSAQKLLLVVPHMQAAMMKAILAQQREIFAFLSQRCSEDLKLVEDIGAATTVPDMVTACLGFYKDAAQQYAQEAGKVTEIGSEGTILAVSNIREQANVVADMMQHEAA